MIANAVNRKMERKNKEIEKGKKKKKQEKGRNVTKKKRQTQGNFIASMGLL